MPFSATRCRLAWLIAALIAIRVFAVDIPTVDERFSIELIAQEPEINTPTGIAVSADGRIWCVENNTHFTPKNYKGYATDRIQIYSDFAADGHAQKITTFAEGFKDAMNIMFAPSGGLYIATRGEIQLLNDTKNAGVCDERVSIAKLDTKGTYPHNGLSGMALGPDGRLYMGFGENLGLPYTLTCADGSALTGVEGGEVFSCTPDGKDLKRVATGFWNPFGLGFDAFGRLFCVDNDPDARPPCRLLHVIRGGDYGFQFRFGRRGLHPFLAWNGEIPGTLPMVSGTGEAPCTVLACEFKGWPHEWRGDLLVTSWGDHLIQRFKLKCAANGATLKSDPEILAKGGFEFRPVGMVPTPDGNSLIVSDWGGVSYPVHGKGRIWRIKLKQPVAGDLQDGGLRARYAALEQGLVKEKEKRSELIDAALKDAAPEIRAEAVRQLGREPSTANEKKLLAVLQDDASPFVKLEVLANLSDAKSADAVLPLMGNPDSFIFGACVDALTRLASPKRLLDRVDASDVRVRLGVLLALHRTGDIAARSAIPIFLADGDSTVRRAAMQWIGSDKLSDLAADMDKAVKNETPREVFEVYIAAKAQLAGIGTQVQTPDDLMAMVVDNPKQPASLRAMALKNLRVDHASMTVAKLKDLMNAGDAALRTEAIRALALHSHPDAQAELRALANDKELAADLRLDVIAGLSRSGTSDETQKLLTRFSSDVTQAAQHREALRALRGAINKIEVEQTVRTNLANVKEADRAEIAEQALFALKSSSAKPDTLTLIENTVGKRPANESEWMEWLKQPGDPAAGRRLFYHPRGAQCFICHKVDGRGGNVGPELSSIARGMSREKIIQSILEPSREIAPMFVPWTFTLKDGKTVTGVIQDEDIYGKVKVADAQGKVTDIKMDNLVKRVAQKTSIMPDNLVETLTKQEFRDLIAFLLTLK